MAPNYAHQRMVFEWTFPTLSPDVDPKRSKAIFYQHSVVDVFLRSSMEFSIEAVSVMLERLSSKLSTQECFRKCCCRLVRSTKGSSARQLHNYIKLRAVHRFCSRPEAIKLRAVHRFSPVCLSTVIPCRTRPSGKATISRSGIPDLGSHTGGIHLLMVEMSGPVDNLEHATLKPSPSHPPAAASESFREQSNEADRDTGSQDPEWVEARMRCLIVTYPLFPHMLAPHAACLRVGTPTDRLSEIEEQLNKAPEVTERYRALRVRTTDISLEEQADLDRVMIEYPLALGSLERTLRHHFQINVAKVMISCWGIEQELYNLTGVRLVWGNH